MIFAPLKPTPKLILLLCLASAATARAQEIGWPIHSTAPPPIAQGYAEFGDVSKTKYHTGLDFGVPLGTEVFPVAEGEVVLVQLLSATADHGFGRAVVMRHGGTGGTAVFSQYAHLSEIDAKLVEACKLKRAADEVTLACAAGVKGTVQDRIGKSGRSGFGVDEYPGYGKHLHIEIKSFGTLCTKDVAGVVCGYSTSQPSTLGYLDPTERLVWVPPFPTPVPVMVTGTGVAVRFTPDAGQGKRSITALDSADTTAPLRGIAWSSGYGSCDEGWIRVRRVDNPDCGAPSGASACFQDTRDPLLKPPDKYLGLVPTGWICAKYLSPLTVPAAREAVTEGILLSGGSVKVTRARAQGLTIELVDRDGLFSVYEAAQLGSDAVTQAWNLIFLNMVYEAPPYKTFAATHQALTSTLLARYGATCAGNATATSNAQAACAVAALAKSGRIRMGGGRYDEGQRCVGWQDHPNGEFECHPY